MNWMTQVPLPINHNHYNSIKNTIRENISRGDNGFSKKLQKNCLPLSPFKYVRKLYFHFKIVNESLTVYPTEKKSSSQFDQFYFTNFLI